MFEKLCSPIFFSNDLSKCFLFKGWTKCLTGVLGMDERGVDFEDVPDIDLNTYSNIRIERTGRPSVHSGSAYEA